MKVRNKITGEEKQFDSCIIEGCYIYFNNGDVWDRKEAEWLKEDKNENSNLRP